MDQDIANCIDTLAGYIEENENGGWKYSGSEATTYKDQILPIILDGIDLSPYSLRMSEKNLRSKLNELVFEVRNESSPADAFEKKLEDLKSRVSDEIDITEYVLAFPLNFHRRSSDLLPNTIQLRETKFQQISRSEWHSEFVPDFDADDRHRQRYRLEQFLKKSPNELEPNNHTFWKTCVWARDEQYAVNYAWESLQTLLGGLNFAIYYNQRQGISSTIGPWPDRWADLRSPFVLLTYSGGEFQNYHYDGQDSSYRKAARPHSHRNELFTEVFTEIPTFDDIDTLEYRLMSGFGAFQTAITEPSERESFFKFWRGIEILTLTQPQESLDVVIDRAERLFLWNEPDIARVRVERALEKRNEYVHEGTPSITKEDKNTVKLLLDALISLYIDQKDNWNGADMRFVLDNSTTDIDQLSNLRRTRKRELEMLDWMNEAVEADSDSE